MKDEFHAHSREGTPPEEWQRLEDHLIRVPEMARRFGKNFNTGAWAYLAGLWGHKMRSWGYQKRVL